MAYYNREVVVAKLSFCVEYYLDQNAPIILMIFSVFSFLRLFPILLWRSCWALIQKDMSIVAGYVAFSAFFALFPFLLLAGSVASTIGSPELAEQAIDTMFLYFPESVATSLAPIIEDVLSNQSGQLLTIGIIGTLWASSSGVEGLRCGLNQAYNITNTPPLWHKRLQSIGIVIITALAFITGAFLIVLLPNLITLAETYIPYLHLPRQGIKLFSYSAAFLVISIATILLHYSLPNRKQYWRFICPGAVLSTLLWLSSASLFGYYIGNFGRFNMLYGSLGGIMITLLFFYLSALFVLLGAEFNRHVEEAFSKQDSLT